MIPPHLFYQMYLSFLEQNDCTPPKCDELSEYTDSAHIEVEDLSSRYINGSNVYDRCGHDTRQLHPSCTACRRIANLHGLAWQKQHSDSERGNPLPQHGLLFPISSKGYGYSVSDIAREETRCRNMGYSFQLAARVMVIWSWTYGKGPLRSKERKPSVAT